MFLSKIAINKPIMATMGLLVFIIFGLISYTKLNINQMPEVEIPFVTVMTVYPGAGPKEIELQVSKKIEDAAATVSEIKRIESYSLDAVSIVMIEFNLGKDVNIANQEVKDKIDAIINQLPSDAERPIVQKVDLQAFPIIDLILTGNKSPQELYDIADNFLKDRFSQIAGVGQVSIIGGQEREIHVNLDGRTVYENMISLPQLIGILAAHNMDMPGGYFDIKRQEFTVRLSGEFESLDEISEIEIPTAFGNKKMRQFGEVVDAGKSVRERAIYFDKINDVYEENIVRLSIIKASDGNAVNISKDIRDQLPEIIDYLPEGVSLDVIKDESTFIQSSIDDTLSNIILGIIFTSVILLFFLHDIRSTFIIALSMPTSIVSTFLLMDLAGFSFNILSLMGLSVSVGVLVANSVVVLENIFRHKEMGKNKKEAAYDGTVEVTIAVVASTLTNIVVFVPLGSLQSMVGRFLSELAFTAAFATVFSLIMSFTLTPMLASIILPNKPKMGALGRMIFRFEKMWERLYHNSLLFTLKNKYISAGIVLAAFALFVLVTMRYGSQLENEFMPTVDDGRIAVQIELPEGYNLEQTKVVVDGMKERLKNYDEVKETVSNLGRLSELDLGTNMALMEIYLVDVEERERGLLEMITTFTQEFSDVPNANIRVNPLSTSAGPGSPIDFFILGQDLEVLERYKDTLYTQLQDVRGLVNLTTSSKPGKPEIVLVPKREILAESGLTVQDLAFTLRAAVEGIVSSKYREGGNEYDIKVTLNDESVNSPEKLASIPVISPMGQVYRMSQLADIEFTQGFSKILHRDKFTAIQFSGFPAEGFPTGAIMEDVQKIIDDTELPAGYSIRWAGMAEMQQEMAVDLGFAFLLAIILTYMLLAAMLESFWQPVMILLTVPLALIGSFVLMYYTDTTLSLTANMGIIMLIGIVVNNAILMLDYTNQLRREEGMQPKDALIKACPTKLKPIIMATLAIILGMLPMALGIGDAGKEFRIPLGIVSIGGLIASTFLTLWVIPSFYYVTSKSKKLKA